jgi:ATP-dependent exoDNAse (exonuclease V) alpha subunit
MIYTGITRAKRQLTLTGPGLPLLESAVKQPLTRWSGLSHRLSMMPAQD